MQNTDICNITADVFGITISSNTPWKKAKTRFLCTSTGTVERTGSRKYPMSNRSTVSFVPEVRFRLPIGHPQHK